MVSIRDQIADILRYIKKEERRWHIRHLKDVALGTFSSCESLVTLIEGAGCVENLNSILVTTVSESVSYEDYNQEYLKLFYMAPVSDEEWFDTLCSHISPMQTSYLEQYQQYQRLKEYFEGKV